MFGKSDSLSAVLELAAGLPPRSLQAIAELEQQVVETDGGRLKLEWATLRGRSAQRVEDLLFWQEDRLVGFLGLYVHGSGAPPELAGMVAPDARGRGIGATLLDAALRLCRQRGDRQPLLIVPRASAAGKRLAQSRGAVLDHSEHALVLSGEPARGHSEQPVSLRPAIAADLPLVGQLLEQGFGHPPGELANRSGAPREGTTIVELEGVAVGTLRIRRQGSAADIHGFVIETSRRGRGIGRAALRCACDQLRADGARSIGLEVDVENDRALGLYTSVGFTPVITEDYYALPLS
jgi:ribosomal protein S18 acetylase RimI-like enzyme